MGRRKISQRYSAVTKIYHAHLYGTRNCKYDWLRNHDVRSTDWKQISPRAPFYLLIPQNIDLLHEYETGWKITEVMPVNVLGFQTHRDHFAIDFDREALKQRINEMRDIQISDKEYAERYSIKNNRDWQLAISRQKIRSDSKWDRNLVECAYRPFDNRSCYFSDVAMDYPRRELLDHVAKRDNLCILSSRQQSVLGYKHCWITNIPANDCLISTTSREANQVFPLYLYPDDDSLNQECRSNFSPKFLEDITAKLSYLPMSEAIFSYIYAVLHSHTYRKLYAEFLRIDFPRIPFTSDPKLFQKLATYGEELVALHLMKSLALDNFISKFEEKSDCVVDPGHPKYSDGEVRINKRGDAFTGVPEEVWNSYIGGYQVCQKWLKDRKGRTLSPEDITHYQRIIVALQETIRLMWKIDEAIPNWPIE